VTYEIPSSDAVAFDNGRNAGAWISRRIAASLSGKGRGWPANATAPMSAGSTVRLAEDAAYGLPWIELERGMRVGRAELLSRSLRSSSLQADPARGRDVLTRARREDEQAAGPRPWSATSMYVFAKTQWALPAGRRHDAESRRKAESADRESQLSAAKSGLTRLLSLPG
jgi:hypothetical protein